MNLGAATSLFNTVPANKNIVAYFLKARTVEAE
jgi:hypothetical protein